MLIIDGKPDPPAGNKGSTCGAAIAIVSSQTENRPAERDCVAETTLSGELHNLHLRVRVAVRVFQRNFSTKSEAGRGLGTYSMKMLAEEFLGGSVDFTTSMTEGTTFRLHLPTDVSRPS